VEAYFLDSRASAEKFPRWGATEKIPKKRQKRLKNSTINPLSGGATEKKTEKYQKNTKNSTFKPLAL